MQGIQEIQRVEQQGWRILGFDFPKVFKSYVNLHHPQRGGDKQNFGSKAKT